MKCETVRLGDTTAIVCRSRGRVQRCATPNCDRPATLLCDFPTKRGTCDAKLCAGCTTKEGDKDHCPKHQAYFDDLAHVLATFNGSDGDMTKTLYARLEQLGGRGLVGLNLFRAHKTSVRAKKYRGGPSSGGSWRDKAYDKKDWSLGLLTGALRINAQACGITWGWGYDPAQEFHSAVLYVELPTGQVSFHTARRGEGPEYPRGWDGAKDASTGRICRWIAQLLV